MTLFHYTSVFKQAARHVMSWLVLLMMVISPITSAQLSNVVVDQHTQNKCVHMQAGEACLNMDSGSDHKNKCASYLGCLNVTQVLSIGRMSAFSNHQLAAINIIFPYVDDNIVSHYPDQPKRPPRS